MKIEIGTDNLKAELNKRDNEKKMKKIDDRAGSKKMVINEGHRD